VWTEGRECSVKVELDFRVFRCKEMSTQGERKDRKDKIKKRKKEKNQKEDRRLETVCIRHL
jgi:hypothetical protein